MFLRSNMLEQFELNLENIIWMFMQEKLEKVNPPKNLPLFSFQVQYNTYDNQGELMTKEEWDRTVMSKKSE